MLSSSYVVIISSSYATDMQMYLIPAIPRAEMFLYKSWAVVYISIFIVCFNQPIDCLFGIV